MLISQVAWSAPIVGPWFRRGIRWNPPGWLSAPNVNHIAERAGSGWPPATRAPVGVRGSATGVSSPPGAPPLDAAVCRHPGSREWMRLCHLPSSRVWTYRVLRAGMLVSQEQELLAGVRSGRAVRRPMAVKYGRWALGYRRKARPPQRMRGGASSRRGPSGVPLSIVGAGRRTARCGCFRRRCGR